MNIHITKIEIHYICASELCCCLQQVASLEAGIYFQFSLDITIIYCIKNDNYMLPFFDLNISFMHSYISQFKMVGYYWGRIDEVGECNVLVSNALLFMIPTQVEVLCCREVKAILHIQRNLTNIIQ